MRKSLLEKQHILERHRLQLIADFRRVPEEDISRSIQKQPIVLSKVLEQALKRQQPSVAYLKNLELLQMYWDDWFKGTDFQYSKPEQFDKWHHLWVKVSNAIICQKLQFKSALFLQIINQLLPEKIEAVHWKV